jgi:hypothetical protein
LSETKVHVDVVDWELVSWFWDLTCDFWAENA